MKKKRTNKVDDGKITMNDILNDDAVTKLKRMNKQLKQEEAAKIEAEKEKKRKERLQREKNKSFAELLDESNLDWKSFK